MNFSFYSIPETVNDDIEFDLVELEQIKIGDNFEVIVNIKNKSSEVRSIDAVLSAASIFYTGVKAKFIKKAAGSFTVKPNASKSQKLLNDLN